jgi:hypothetical protein
VAVWVAAGKDNLVTNGMGARFDATGHLLGPPTVLVSNAIAYNNCAAALSVSGNEMLLVWQNYSAGVLARRLAPDLTWLDAQPSVLMSRANLVVSYDFFRLGIAANAQRHGVVITSVYDNPSKITFVRLGPAALPVQESFVVDTPADSSIQSVAVAARPEGFLIAWEANAAGPGGNSLVHLVQARTTGMAGVATGPLQTLMAPTDTGGDINGYAQAVSAAPLGDGYAVAWSYSHGSGMGSVPEFPRRWIRTDAAGAPVAPAQEFFPPDPNPISNWGPHLISLQPVNGGLLAVTSETVPNDAAPHRRLIRRFFSADGSAGPVEAFGGNQAMRPEPLAVHATGTGLLAVGEVRTKDVNSSRMSVIAAPLTDTYTWGQPARVVSAGIPEQQSCAVACRGTDYLVVWQDGRDGHLLAAEIRGRFFGLNGTPSGESFRISDAPSEDVSPAVAASGGKYLVAWTRNRTDDPNDDIMGAIVTAPGAVSAPFSVAAREDRQESGVSVAGGPDGGFFAAWRSNPVTGQDRYDQIHGAWISGNGGVSPAVGFPVAASQRGRAVSVAGGAGTYGCAWREGNSNTSYVYGAVVPGTPPATPVTPDRIAFTESGNGHAPEIAWNGSHYRLVWREAGNTSSPNAGSIRSATLSEGGAAGTVRELSNGMNGTTKVQFFEPAIVPWNGGWQVFWHEDRQRVVLPYGVGDEFSVKFASLDSAGQVTGLNRFAPRFIDKDTLSAASAPDGGILVVYPVPAGRGKELLRTGALESVLLYPGRQSDDPPVSVTVDGSLTTLRWKPDPWFPRDAGVCETATDLLQWTPLLQSLPALEAQDTGGEASVTFPGGGGPHRFYRLNSSVPGSP